MQQGDVLLAAHIHQRCHECGGSYRVTLHDLLAEHRLLKEWSPARSCSACSTDFYLLLQSIPQKAIESLDEAWRDVVRAAEDSGLTLQLSRD